MRKPQIGGFQTSCQRRLRYSARVGLVDLAWILDGQPHLVLLKVVGAPGADFDFDGDVDESDFLNWQRRYVALTNSTVPEPGAVVLSEVALAMSWTFVRQRR